MKAARAGEVLVTRQGRWVFLGIKGRGHVQLRPAEAEQLAAALLAMVGTPAPPVEPPTL